MQYEKRRKHIHKKLGLSKGLPLTATAVNGRQMLTITRRD